MMVPRTEVEALIHDLFEEEALALGGLVALHDIEDDLVWRIVRNMDLIRSKTLRRLENSDADDGDVTTKTNFTPHPAIEEFLSKVRRT